MNIKKRLMTEEEYSFWCERSRINYALEKQKANGLTSEEATELARKSFENYLPQKYHTENHFLRTVVGEGNELVGFYWFALIGAANNKRAFIYDIIVEENMRGKGFGRKVMELIEAEVKELGIKSLSLHVFASNKVAVGLYDSLNFEVTDLVMEKKLL